MNLKPYKKTKPSGVEWLGDVPEHWEVKRLGYLFRFFSGGTPSTSDRELWDGEIPWVSSKDMKSMVISDTEDHISEDAVRISATSIMPKGSLLMVNRSGILRHSIPVGVTTREMAINQDIRGCVPSREVDAKFIAYLIHGNQKQLLPLWRQQGATVESLEFESVKTSNLCLPPLPEQRTIAAFLDRETGRIDLLVVKKRELIERLKEKRTALISRTVTRGLPPAAAKAAGLPVNPKMKDSEVEWLGEIPGHWEVKRLSYLAMLKSGESINSEMIAEGGDYPVYGGNGFRGHYHSFTHRGHFALIGRQGALCGNINYASGEFWASEHALVVIPLTKFSVVWIGELLRTMNLGQYSVTAAQPGISAEMISGLRIPVPPLPEQEAIAAYLDTETAKLDALVAKVEEAVERLQEYRTALITAAVTGKIDVRKASA